MMPGNYARVLFDIANEDLVVELIASDDRKTMVKSALEKFRFLRQMYRAKDPIGKYPDDIREDRASGPRPRTSLS